MPTYRVTLTIRFFQSFLSSMYINAFNGAMPFLNMSIGLAMVFAHMHPAQAKPSDDLLNRVNQSMELCLDKASRPGFPYYHRPEAKEACDKTKSLLMFIAKDANRSRNLGCSNRALSLSHDLWMIQFLGESRWRTQAISALSNLETSCCHIIR